MSGLPPAAPRPNLPDWPPGPPAGQPAWPPGPIPPELDRWNWGAFLLHWVWGIGNSTYIALLAWVPGIGILVMPFWLGARGSAWAWCNARFESVEHFRRVQRLWAIWGVVVWLGIAAIFGSIVGGVLYALNTSEAYRLAVERVETSPRAAALLGSPIAAGWPSGSISTSGETGSATIAFSVTGPKGHGTVTAEARKGGARWVLTTLLLTVSGQADGIDLLHEERAQAGDARCPT